MSCETDKVLLERNDKACFGSTEIIMQSFLSTLLHHSVSKNNCLGSNSSDLALPLGTTQGRCTDAVSQRGAIRKEATTVTERQGASIIKMEKIINTNKLKRK